MESTGESMEIEEDGVPFNTQRKRKKPRAKLIKTSHKDNNNTLTQPSTTQGALSQPIVLIPKLALDAKYTQLNTNHTNTSTLITPSSSHKTQPPHQTGTTNTNPAISKAMFQLTHQRTQHAYEIKTVSTMDRIKLADARRKSSLRTRTRY